jgi:hypothetical protein
MAEGKKVRVPRRVASLLSPNEQVLAVCHESRFKSFLTPDSIYVTNQRVVRYSPAKLGLKVDIEDYRFQDMANVEVRSGLVFGEVDVDMRFESEHLLFKNITKGAADVLHKYISQGILSVVAAMPMMAGGIVATVPTVNLVQILQERLAKGEISQDQYEEMLKTLQEK